MGFCLTNGAFGAVNASLVDTVKAGGVRSGRAYNVTPWNSTGLDGGSHESLIKRYSALIQEMEAEEKGLKAKIASLK